MDDQVQIVDCYYATLRDRPGEGHRFLEHISERAINVVAFTAIPTGAEETQVGIVTDHPDSLLGAAADAGVTLIGPRKAFLIQGDDRVGALHSYHQTLSNAGVNVYSSSGVSSGDGRYGFILWVEPADFDKAFDAFGIGG